MKDASRMRNVALLHCNWYYPNGRRVPTLGDHWARGCDYKVGYPSREAAERNIEGLERKEGIPFNSYLCTCCGRWHVGRRTR